MSSPIFSMSFMRSCRYDWFIVCVVPCMPSMNGIELCSIGVPSGRVMVCTRPIPGWWNMLLATRSMTRKSAELRRSWSLSIISSSGLSRAAGKCRSAAAKPSAAGMSGGR